jgi:hypothetical protein
VPLLHRNPDSAFAQAAVDALIKRGIEAYATGSTDPAGAAGTRSAAEYCVFVGRAADAERATRILARLGAAPAGPAAAPGASTPRWLVWTIVLLVAGLAMFVALQSGGAP